jgi:hypothetical protein
VLVVVLVIIVLAASSPFIAFLWCVAVFCAWTGSLYLWPFAPCIKCRGSGRNRGSNPRKRFGQCRRCGGSGHRIRPGAKTVHRGRVSLAERKRKGKGR